MKGAMPTKKGPNFTKQTFLECYKFLYFKRIGYFPKDDWISKDICILHSALFVLSSLESNNISTLHLPIFFQP